VKLDGTGSRLWATYYGGIVGDWGYGIATDGSGNVLITGLTESTDFPVTAGAFQTSYGGGTKDAFVVKFDLLGNRLWATYYGGNGDDGGSGIATDGSGNVLITGKTVSTNFPFSAGAFQTSFGGVYDAFVVKLDGNDGYPIWATWYGGSVSDFGSGITTDGSGNVLITGGTESTDFPITSGAFRTSLGGDQDAFVVKFDPAGNQLWATYYGGSDYDRGYDIATDGIDNVVITGPTESANLPLLGAFQTSYGGGGIFGGDAFVVKFDPAGNQLWATYYGGSDADEGFGITADDSNNIYLAGDTYSTDFPITPGAFQTVKNGPAGTPNEENYMVKFDANGTRICGTYLGGNGHDEGAHEGGGNIAVYREVVYMTGFTPGDYPVTAGAFQTSNAGDYDAWIAQLCDDCTLNCSISLFVNATAFPKTICKDSCTNLSSTAGFGTGAITFSWTSIPPGFTSSTQNPGMVCPDITTTYIVTVDDDSSTATASVTVNVEDCDTTENIFFIPNSFSPNKDGDNDILLIRGSGIKNIKLFIYNRWGEKVFETNDINKGWDGTYRKKPLNTGVFAWYAAVEFIDDSKVYRKGNVTSIK